RHLTLGITAKFGWFTCAAGANLRIDADRARSRAGPPVGHAAIPRASYSASKPRQHGVARQNLDALNHGRSAGLPARRSLAHLYPRGLSLAGAQAPFLSPIWPSTPARKQSFNATKASSNSAQTTLM